MYNAFERYVLKSMANGGGTDLLDAIDTGLEAGLSGLDAFPSKVWLLHNGEKLIGYHYVREKLDGIACFRSENAAVLFVDHVQGDGVLEAREHSFDDAVEIARARKAVCPQLSCLFLVDRFDPRDPPSAVFWL